VPGLVMSGLLIEPAYFMRLRPSKGFS